MSHRIHFDDDFDGSRLARIEVGEVSNDTGRNFDFDLEQALSDALTAALAKEKLLWTGSPSSERYALACRIVDYKEGNAVKRWLLPGWGTTVLAVHAELSRVKDGELLGSIDQRRTISFGGLYTIGAWKSIFRKIAHDLVREIAAKLDE